jgi:iron-sulfur cluster insertion protein
MLTITESAVAKIQELIAEENEPGLKVRVYVEGGGCSGFQYGFMFEDVQNEDDFEINGAPVLADASSMQYLTGATIDYTEDLTGSQFKIINPNAQTTCGCGSSFSV